MSFIKDQFDMFFTSTNKNFINLVQAADNGEEWAKREIDKMFNDYDHVLVVSRIEQARAIIYKNGAMRGDRTSILRYARGLEWCGQRNEALNWYMKLINQGDTGAMVQLADDYGKYEGLGENETEKRRWLFSAANAGNDVAQAKLGREMWYDGNIPEAAKWYKISARYDNLAGICGYARCLQIELETMAEYFTGLPLNKPNKNNYLFEYLSEHEIKTREDYLRKAKNIYVYIEDSFLDVLSNSQQETNLSEACHGLSRLYMYPPYGTVTPDRYRGAYYQYILACIEENRKAYDFFWELVHKYGLQITENDLKVWDKESFDDWAQKKNLYLRN